MVWCKSFFEGLARDLGRGFYIMAGDKGCLCLMAGLQSRRCLFGQEARLASLLLLNGFLVYDDEA